MEDKREQAAAPRGWSPGQVPRALVRPPCSKSHAIRALLAAGLARGTTRLHGLSRAQDVLAAGRVLTGSGVALRVAPDGLAEVHGLAPDSWCAHEPLDVGESGTVARLATAVLALVPPAGTRAELQARGSLRTRSSEPLLAALRGAGARLEPAAAHASWPLSLVSATPPRSLSLTDPCSSQELSGLLLALAACPGPHRVELSGELPSRPYAEMTLELLRSFGARVVEDARGFEVEGPLVAPADELRLEPDASAAAVALAAACLGGGATRVEDLDSDSLQGDVRITQHLAAFGCRAESRDGALHASGAPTRGAKLDLSGEPDLAPVLVAVAAAVALRGAGEAARSKLSGLETLNAKECRRLDVLANALEQLGLEVRATHDTLEVAPGRPTSGPLVLDPHGDHRMVFAFALLGLVRPGILVANPDCVAKSWPDFWEACFEGALPEN